MTPVKIIPKSGTIYKYRLLEVFGELKSNNFEQFKLFNDAVRISTGKSRMTIWRWQKIKHGDKEDIPHSCLRMIAWLLTQFGIDTTANQLTNYLIVQPIVTHSSERAPMPEYFIKMT